MFVRAFLCAAVVVAPLLCTSMTAENGSRATAPRVDQRDGQHDWDNFFGTWKMHLRRRLHPLTGSNEWVSSESHDSTRPLLGGRANLDELEADGPSGHVEGLTVRLYNPHTRQWSIYWANSASPALDTPMVGRFAGGRGEFYDQEMFGDRPVFVRFLWTNVSSRSGDFEQAFSADGGRTWEPNWVTRMEREPPGRANVPPNPDRGDGQHGFDFEAGRWSVHEKQRVEAADEPQGWRAIDGTLRISPIWNGRANIAEFQAANAAAGGDGLSVRLFDPHVRQWSVYFASLADGRIDLQPLAGGFRDGRGEFIGTARRGSQWVLVRLVVSATGPNSVHEEQAQSRDGGRTWETVWTRDLIRVGER